MKKILIIFTLLFDCSFSAGNLENTLNHCCNMGKTWSYANKSCNITLSLPLFNVATEHNSVCLTTIGACCLLSLRELRCNEGKQVGLENGICEGKGQSEKNQVDFMMCCEICKIGITAGSTKSICQSTPLFNNHQWGEVYQSCCRSANTKIKLISTDSKKNYDTTDKNPCLDGTHNCNSQEKCINTPSGVECQSRDLPLPLRMPPMPFGSIIKNKKKQDCDDGYTYSVYEQQCKDIDECAQLPCEVNELCENTIGSFKCHCKSGFQLDNITNACTDINECQLNIHTCHESQRCDNSIGSYQCVRFTGCGTGYTLDVETSTCLDDDECALKTDTCSILGPDWMCKNTLGSFRCIRKRCNGPNCGVQQVGSLNRTSNLDRNIVKCPRGHEKDSNNKCIDINECKSQNRCLKNEICINTNGSYYCLPRSKNFPI